jgi:hypothetical protein
MPFLNRARNFVWAALRQIEAERAQLERGKAPQNQIDALDQVRAALTDGETRLQEIRKASGPPSRVDRMRLDWRLVAAGTVAAIIGVAGVVALAIYLLTPPAFTTEERACADYIQGRIAWNDDGNTQWTETSLKDLCQGTERPVQPGLCFNNIRNIPLERGAEVQRDWKNAVALCTGTNDAQERISCYRNKVALNQHFRDAIETCAPLEPIAIAGRTSCERLVQGNIAWNRERDTDWSPQRLGALCGETEKPTQPLLCFDRLFHGSGPWDKVIAGQSFRAIQLCAGTDSASGVTSCVSQQLARLDGAGPPSEPESADAGEPTPQAQARADRLFEAVRQACNPRRPTDRSAQCKSFVQGDIVWSGQGYDEWQPAILEELCGNTRQPQQPGFCFSRAFNGEIAFDAQGESKWAYAVRLCAGTNNADSRLACYTNQRNAGKDSLAAIQACKEAEQD